MALTLLGLGLGLGLGLVAVAVVVVLMVKQNQRVPRLGVEQGRLRPLSKKPNGVSSQAEAKKQRVAALPFSGSQAETLAALRKVVSEMPGSEILQQDADYLRVVFSTPLLKFRDDVEFYLDESSRSVAFRSSSRVGYSDLGVNRERYRTIAARYAQQANV